MPDTKKHGFVIALDGPDGVGKSTQVNLLVDYIQSKDRVVHSTRHSGGTPIGEELRKVSLSSFSRPAETDLYISLAMGAALAEDVKRRKKSGEVIIIDRSPLAVVAYNGYGNQLQPIKQAFDACESLFLKLQIDLLIFMSADQETIEIRRIKRGVKDYFENQNAAYHGRVRDGYRAGLEFLQNHPELGAKVETIDASGTIDEIHRLIINASKL